MPIFEYICNNCGHSFEKLIRRSEPTIACPNCSSEKTTKKLSSFAVNGCDSKKSSGGHSCSSCSGGRCSTCCG